MTSSGVPQFRCPWCWIAAGRPPQELYRPDQLAEHEPRCEHNPLTKVVRAYFAAVDDDSNTDEADDALDAAGEELRKAVSP